MKKNFIALFVLFACTSIVFGAHSVEELELLCEQVLREEVCVPQAFRVALEEVNNENTEVRGQAFNLLYSVSTCHKVISEKSYQDKIFEVIVKQVRDVAYQVRRTVLVLCELLIEQGVFLDEIHEIVLTCLSDEHYKVKTAALEVFETFVEQGFYYKEAFEFSESILATDKELPRVKKAALKVHNALLKKGQYQRLIMERAREELENSNGLWNDAYRIIGSSEGKGYDADYDSDGDMDECVDCDEDENMGDWVDDMGGGCCSDEECFSTERLISCVMQGDSYHDAMEVAETECNNSSPHERKKALNLYAALVKQGQAYDAAKVASLHILNNKFTEYCDGSSGSEGSDFGEHYEVVSAAKNLLIALIRNGQVCDEAIRLTDKLKDNDVMEALIEQGVGYGEIINFLKKEFNDLNSLDDLLESYRPSVLVALVEKNQACDLAKIWALKIINNLNVIEDRYEIFSQTAIDILIALVRQNQSIDEALEVADSLPNLDLFAVLIHQGHGSDRALDLLKNSPGLVWTNKKAACFLEVLFNQGLINAQQIFLFLKGTDFFEFHLEQFSEKLRNMLLAMQS